MPVLILGGGIGVFAALKATRPAQPAAEVAERVWRVEVEQMRPRTLAPAVTLYGRVETPSLFKAAAPLASRVDRVAVREGDRVAAGQLLVGLDPRDFTPRLDQARAEVAELDAGLRSERNRHASDLTALEQERKLLALAQAAVERARKLLQQRLGADSAVDEAEQALARQALAVTTRELAVADHPARLQALEARLRKAKAQLADVELDVERSQVHAPYDGVIARVEVAEGDQVKDSTVLLSLYAVEDLELRARIPARYQDELRRALEDGAVLEGEHGAGASRVGLRLARLAGQADSSGLDGLFRIVSGGAGLRPGQVLRFRLDRPTRDGAVPVPFQALYGESRVYTLEDGRLRGWQVEPLGSWLDPEGRERLLVTADGLGEGALLVVTHLPNAVAGLKAEAAP